MGGHRFSGAGQQSAGTSQYRGSAFTIAGNRDAGGVVSATIAFSTASTSFTASTASRENTGRTKIRTQAQGCRQAPCLAYTSGAENRGADNGPCARIKCSRRGASTSGTCSCRGSRNAICAARSGQNQRLCIRRICGKQSEAGLSCNVQTVWRRRNGNSARARESRRHGRASGNTIVQRLSSTG